MNLISARANDTGNRDKDYQSPGCICVIPRDDYNWAGLSSYAKISEPNITASRAHLEYREPLVQLRENAECLNVPLPEK